MNETPFFSVVIPTYNRAEMLPETIDRVLRQNFSNLEVIIVDDGSTDDTSSVLKKIAGDSPSVRIISQENKERGAARNSGVKNALGKYIVFLDSDDLMQSNHLDVLHDYINRLNFPDFVSTKFDFIDDNGNSFPSGIKDLSEGFYDYKLFLDGNILACNVCVKRDLQDLFLFVEDRAYSIKEDWLFLIQNTQTHRLFIIDKVTVTMRDHEDRSMRSDNSRIISKTFLAMNWILEKIALNPEERKKLQAHVNYFCGIHSYLDNKKAEGMRYALRAMNYGGIKIKYVTLFLKSLLGIKTIRRIK